MGRRLPRTLGWRHAHRRHGEFFHRHGLHCRRKLQRSEPGPPSDRTLHARRRRYAPLRIHRGRPCDMDRNVDGPIADDADQRTDLRICVSRRKLLDAEHPVGRSRGGESSVRVQSTINLFGEEWAVMTTNSNRVRASLIGIAALLAAIAAAAQQPAPQGRGAAQVNDSRTTKEELERWMKEL